MPVVRMQGWILNKNNILNNKSPHISIQDLKYMYGFKHSDTCIINKIIQKYVTKFFLPSILVQELLHLKKYPMAMQLFHNIITCTHILQIQSNKLHPLPSRIVYGFQDSVNTYKSSMHSFSLDNLLYCMCIAMFQLYMY